MSHLEQNLDAWYRETTAFFRSLGFFGGTAPLEGEALASWVKQRVISMWNVPMLPEARRDQQLADMVLLGVDRVRVWMKDLEGVFEGEYAYAKALREWSIISRGTFFPEQINERWSGSPERAEVTWLHRGERFVFVHPGGDMMDMRIIRDVNRSVTAEMQFSVCDNFGMPNFVAALTSAERTQLERDRKWRFWMA